MQARELAERLGLSYDGPDVEIDGVNTLESAGPTDLTFLVNPKYAPQLETTRAGAVLVAEEYQARHPAVMVSANVYMDLARAIGLFARPQGCLTGQHALAFVHETAEVDPSATVYPFAFVGAVARLESGVQVFPGVYVGERCRVGEGSVLYPGAVLMADTELGREVIVQPGAVLGADGFGYAQTGSAHMKIPQIGVTRVADGAEVGANSCVDRAALDATVVGEGTKIDNLVQIGHNVRLGSHCLLAAMVGISGSTRLGDRVFMGGGSGVGDNVTVGDDCMIGGKAGVQQDLEAGSKVSGYLAMDYRDFLKVNARMPQLPELFRRVRKLEKELMRLSGAGAKGEGHE